MSKEPNNIDRLIREKLDGFEMTPPSSVWNSTSSILKSRRKKTFFLYFTLVMLVLIFSSIGVYFSSQEDSKGSVLSQRLESDKKHSLKNVQIEKPTTNTQNESLNNSNENIANKSEINLPFSSTGNSSGVEYRNSANQHFDGSNLNNSNTLNSINLQSKSINLSGIDLQSKKIDKKKTKITMDESTNKFSPNGTNESTTHEKNASNKRIEVAESGSIESLSTSPIELLAAHQSKKIENKFQKVQISNPFWKSFSIDGSVGVSSFMNKAPEKSTAPGLLPVLNSASSNRQSLDLRFGLNYHFNSRLSFQTGLEYYSSKEAYVFEVNETTTFQYLDSVATSFDTLTGDSIYLVFPIIDSTSASVQQKASNFYKTLTIPFHFAWNSPVGIRGRLEFALGGALSIYGKNNGTTILDANNVIQSKQAYHTKGMLSLSASIKYLHQFGNHHAVYVEPWAKYGITSQSTPSLMYKSFRHRYGVRIGYRLYF